MLALVFKTTIPVFALLFLGEKLSAQNQMIGKVEFYKSFPSEIKLLQSSSDKQIKYLNHRKHRIELTQGLRDTVIITDPMAIFKFNTSLNDSLFIKVNPGSKVICKTFAIHPKDISDTLKLSISDKRLAGHIDSLQAPKFYQKYNERQAELDFKNGSAKLLGSGSFLGEETLKRHKKFSEKYNFEYAYIFGCFGSRSQRRIAFRYNKAMKKLLGIEENVW